MALFAMAYHECNRAGKLWTLGLGRRGRGRYGNVVAGVSIRLAGMGLCASSNHVLCAA